ncbi:hypothetical protein FSST1_009835 [Fusarium sambucinum]
MVLEEKYIGLGLAIGSSIAIGISFVITKKGLIEATEQYGFAGDRFAYLRSPMWWVGIITLIFGEVGNLAAYAFAPAILVTPLGAFSVLTGAVLGSYFLQEELGILGKIGSAICLQGALLIVLHAPPNEGIRTIDEVLSNATRPSFLLYVIAVIALTAVMIRKYVPLYGKTNPLVYLSICAAVGSVSVMSTKAFGIALKLSLAGDNQFTHPATYAFMVIMTVCILIQMNYFNMALTLFPSNIVNPVYYVFFTTATLCASLALFGGLYSSGLVQVLSLACGLLLIFAGVYLLNMSRCVINGH